MVKNSNEKSVIALPKIFEDKITHLPKDTKATDVINLINEIGARVSAEVMGISPMLIGVGQSAGHISMESIIDNNMLNNIIPLRENYSNQFSKFIAKIVGVDLVKFNEYEMKQKTRFLNLLLQLQILNLT